MTRFRPQAAQLVVAAVAMWLLSTSHLVRAQVAAPAAPAGARAAVAAESEPDGAMKTLAVVAGERYDDLIKDVTFLGTVVGRPEIGQMVEGGIAFFTQGKGLDAIDKTKPWGVIVQTDGIQLQPVGCLPVRKLDDLLNVVAAFGIEVKDVAGGVKEIAKPGGQAVYLKEQAGWAFIGPSSATLANVPRNPQAVFDRLVRQYDVAAHFKVQNIPPMYRQFAIQAMQSGMQQGMQQKDGESDEQFKLRQQVAEAQLQQAKRAIEELDALTLGWTVDAEQQSARMEVVMQVVPGSQLAQEIAAQGDATTRFAGFHHSNAAARVAFSSQSDPQLAEKNAAQLEATMTAAREQLNNGIDENEKIPAEVRDDLKAALGDFFDAFLATAKTGRMDGAASLLASADSVTLVAGAAVAEPAKFEDGLKKLEAAAKRSPEFPGIQWNADSHAGVAFHTLTVPVPADQAAPRQLLGDEASIAFGIGPDAVYLAAGRDNLATVKKAMDASAAQHDKQVEPFELALSVGPVAEVLAVQAEDGPQREAAQAIADLLRAEAPGSDHIRITGNVIPNGLRYRFEAERGVLKALGKAAAEKQRQAQQASQFLSE